LKEEPDHPSAPDWARALENLDRARRLGDGVRLKPGDRDA